MADLRTQFCTARETIMIKLATSTGFYFEEGERHGKGHALDLPEPAHEDHRRERTGNRHQRADREVDAAGGDDQRHASRDDDDGGDLREVHVEGLPGQEIRRHRDVEGDERQEGDEGAVPARQRKQTVAGGKRA